MDDAVVIVGFARTPLGEMQGVFKDVSAARLGGYAIAGAMADAKLVSAPISEVIMGCVLTAGLGQAPARQAALAAAIPRDVPTNTINKVCGSGLKALILGHHALKVGYADTVVAGGMENMTRAPYLLDRARNGYRLGHAEIYDHMFLDGLQDATTGDLMGHYAEVTAEKFGITRERQDAFAEASLSRAKRAIAEGKFKREICPVTLKTRRGTKTVSDDEIPPSANPEKIRTLRPAFKKDGTVTAANASSIADGAAAFILMRESDARSQGLTPIARITGFTEHAQDPEWFTTAPIAAVKKLLQGNHWSVNDVDLFEINEAFAVVALTAIQELKLDHSNVNVHGGACALGHPLGATGARMMATLIAALQTYNKKRGVAALCIGGGEGIAMGIEIV